MARLDLKFVNRLSLVDEPEVGDARYLVTKRSAPAGDGDNAGVAQDDSRSGESGRGADSDIGMNMDESELNERLEEQHEETIEAATEAATEAASEAATEAVEKALEDADFGGAGSEDGTDDRNLTDADLDELEKRLGDSEDDGDVDVSDERRKEIEAVVKGMDGDGRKAHATQTAGEGEGEQFTDRFVADAGGDA